MTETAVSNEDCVAQRVALTVVIPAHNSESVIESTLGRLADRLEGQGAEIIVVENGSTDQTGARCRAIAQDWQHASVRLRVLSSAKGMGNALRVGALASAGARVLLTADDLPFGFDDLDGADALGAALPPVVIGSKAHRDSVVDRGVARSLLTGGFAVLRRLVLGMRTGDPQGTVLIEGALARRLAGRLVEPGFLFTTELVYAAELAGIVPYEVPVRLSDDHAQHGTRIAFSDIISMATGLVRLRRRNASLAASV